MVHLFIYSTNKPESIRGNRVPTVNKNKKLHFSEGFYSIGERASNQSFQENTGHIFLKNQKKKTIVKIHMTNSYSLFCVLNYIWMVPKAITPSRDDEIKTGLRD